MTSVVTEGLETVGGIWESPNTYLVPPIRGARVRAVTKHKLFVFVVRGDSVVKRAVHLRAVFAEQRRGVRTDFVPHFAFLVLKREPVFEIHLVRGQRVPFYVKGKVSVFRAMLRE